MSKCGLDERLLEVLHRALQKNTDCGTIQEYYCGLLCDLCKRVCVKDSSNLKTDTLIMSILKAMKIHASNSSIQEKACEILGNLAFSYENHRVSIASNDGIELILSALKQHPSVPEVQIKGRAVLWELAYTNNEEIRKKIANTKQGIELIAYDCKDSCCRIW